MELIKVLEDKVITLVDTVHKLKQENKALKQKNEELCLELEAVTKSAQEGSQRASELDKEKESTTLLVDDLIKSIDSLVQDTP